MYVRTAEGLGQEASPTEPGFLDVLNKAAEAASAPSPLVTGALPLVTGDKKAGKAIAAGAPQFQRAKAIMKPAIPREKACWIQTVLNKTSGQNLVPDGLYGRRTREAVRQFQRRSGLSADSIVGPRTNTALIQTALNHMAQASLVPVDGVMDARVQQEIKRFQTANNLVPDGIVGPKTRAAMVLALGGRCQAPAPGKPASIIPAGRIIPAGGPKCDKARLKLLIKACKDRAIRDIADAARKFGLDEKRALKFALAVVTVAAVMNAVPALSVLSSFLPPAAIVGGHLYAFTNLIPTVQRILVEFITCANDAGVATRCF